MDELYVGKGYLRSMDNFDRVSSYLQSDSSYKFTTEAAGSAHVFKRGEEFPRVDLIKGTFSISVAGSRKEVRNIARRISKRANVALEDFEVLDVRESLEKTMNSLRMSQL